MVPPGSGWRLYKPIKGAIARLTGSTVTITMQMSAPSDAYECELAEAIPPFAHEIAGQRGVLLAVTYAADPLLRRGGPSVPRALRDRRVLCGWVPLSARWDLPEQMLTGSDRSTPETGNRQP
jgi:hypothetical protein